MFLRLASAREFGQIPRRDHEYPKRFVDTLVRSGSRHGVNPVDYGPDLKTTQGTTNAYVADLVATGANTTRTWGTGSTTSNLLTAVDNYNAHVVMGFWLNQNVNYCTASNLNTTLNQIVNWVNSYKNDPGVLVWDIGNEVILQAQNYFSGTTLQNDRVCYAQFVNQISQAIHAADPNHPTTSTDAWTGAWPYYASYSPDLDMLAVNSYGGICSVQSAWAAGPNNNGVSYAKPYIVTEFGPSGEWEVPNVTECQLSLLICKRPLRIPMLGRALLAPTATGLLACRWAPPHSSMATRTISGAPGSTTNIRLP